MLVLLKLRVSESSWKERANTWTLPRTSDCYGEKWLQVYLPNTLLLWAHFFTFIQQTSVWLQD